MLIFVLRRTLIAIPVLLVSSMIVYALVAFAGNPLGDLLAKNPRPPASVIEARREDLGLNDPVYVRYGHWLSKFVRGDFGKSSQFSGLSISGDLWHRLGVTTLMVALAMVLAVVFAVISGVLAAVKQYTVTDYGFTFLGFVFLSVPVFFLAGLFKQGAIKLNTDVFDGQVLKTTGDSTPLTTGFTNVLTDRLSHLVLPTIALAAISYATWSRFQRAAMLDVLNSDYIRLARAKGLSRRRVMVRHALRTALIPLTTVVAIDVGGILGGAVLTERVFVWHGMGEMLLQSVTAQDVNRVLAWLMVSALIVVLFNLIADVLYAFLDPRIRYA